VQITPGVIGRVEMKEFGLAEQNYRYLFDNATDAIWVHDLDGIIVVANKACETLTGYTHEELIGMNVSRFLNKRFLAKARRVRHTLVHGEPMEQPYELREIKKDGTIAIVKVTTNLFISGGELKGFQFIGRDVTEEQRMHENVRQYAQQFAQAEKLSALGELAAAAAHEINNPLAGVLIYCRLLSEKINRQLLDKDKETADLGKEMMATLAKMEQAVTYCANITRGLLDFARESKPNVAPVTLRLVIDNSLALVGSKAKLKNIEIVREEDPGIKPITADFQQLEQVFVNLIVNAMQAMPDGGKLTIRTRQENDWVTITVQDTGQGIPSKNLPKLFTPFFTTKEKGTGLGLAISHGIIERHGGTIKVESETGKGTTFTIRLPKNAPAANSPPPPAPFKLS
jgi:PAS domain S-box-containing protein